jgi:ribosomal protein S18 acetylase RimI-like enzyme
VAEFRWRLVKDRDRPAAEAFLRERESRCVTFCARFRAPGRGDHLWALTDKRRLGDSVPGALLLHHNRMLFPLLGGMSAAVAGRAAAVPVPGFLARFLGLVPLHAVHGPRPDTEFLEAALERQGLTVWDEFFYDLLSLDGPPAAEALRSGPPELEIKRPGLEHLDELFALQGAYEREEVLPRGAAFNAPASRLNVQRILAEEFLLAAWLDGKVVGKINTNAESFTRNQIGGVYVLPEYRNLGIAGRLTAELAAELFRRGRNATLFVKTWNAAARSAYFRAGFVKTGDYRICYY